MRSWPQKTEKRARIEIIPMIDVMMFLLVFFVLISTNVIPALGLKVNPPVSGHPDKVLEKTKFIVGIDKEGRTFLDGAPMELIDLIPRLRAAAAEKPTTVVIAGDESTALQNLVSVLDALKSAGISSAQIVTRAK
jgi:biopolymer transport protein ExbD